MKLAAISFTRKGTQLNKRIRTEFLQEGVSFISYGIPKYAEKSEVYPLEKPVHIVTGKLFKECDGILFIGAAGIAVRSIAPYLQGKDKDPAVLVLDEEGRHVISLLSGHLGGANELAYKVAQFIGAVPVITTATDINRQFAVDIFAKKNKLYIQNLSMVKAVSADILEYEEVEVLCDGQVKGVLPMGLYFKKEAKSSFIKGNGTSVYIGIYEKHLESEKVLMLIPKVVAVGIGCRKNTPFEAIERRILGAFKAEQISLHALEQIASIDLKKEEEGICHFAKKYKVPFVTFKADELLKVNGSFQDSSFVEEVTGVGNVCERSAVLLSQGKLIRNKDAGEQITVALAVKEWSVEFE